MRNDSIIPTSPVPQSRALVLYNPGLLIKRNRADTEADALHAERAREAGLTKPHNWPAIMAWPPKTLREAMRNGDLNEENMPKFQAYYNKYADKTVERARKIRANLEANSSLNEDFERVGIFRKKKRFNYDDEALHEHIAWASLIDPHGDHFNAYEKTVTSWGRQTMTLSDGGKVKIKGDRIRVTKMSESAMRLMVEEAAARGWETMDVVGDPKFVQSLQVLGKQHGIRIEGLILTHPLSIFGKKFESNPTALRDKEAMQELGLLRHELAASMASPTIKNSPQIAEPSQEQEIPMG